MIDAKPQDRWATNLVFCSKNQGRHMMRTGLVAAILAVMLSACGTPHRDVFLNPTFSPEKVEQDFSQCIDFGNETGGANPAELIGVTPMIIAAGGVVGGVVGSVFYVILRNKAERAKMRWNCRESHGYALVRVPRKEYRRYRRSGNRHARMQYLWKQVQAQPNGPALMKFFTNEGRSPISGAWAGEAEGLNVAIAIDGSLISAKVNCSRFSAVAGAEAADTDIHTTGKVTWDGHVDIPQTSDQSRLVGQMPNLRLIGNSGCDGAKVTLSKMEPCEPKSDELCTRLEKLRADRVLLRKLVAEFLVQKEADKTVPKNDNEKKGDFAPDPDYSNTGS